MWYEVIRGFMGNIDQYTASNFVTVKNTETQIFTVFH